MPVTTPSPPRAPMPETVNEPSSEKHLLNIEEASKRLSISKATGYKYVSERRIPFLKIGSRLLFAEEQLQDWIDQRRVDPI